MFGAQKSATLNVSLAEDLDSTKVRIGRCAVRVSPNLREDDTMADFLYLVHWILGFGTGYCLHILVATSVCEAYGDYFFKRKTPDANGSHK